MSPARILIIAGSDSGGGAGVQADLKTVTLLGGFGMTAITAITAQNTLGVQGVHPVPTDMVLAQMESCIGDIGVDAVKIGMLGTAETIDAVAVALAELPPETPVVFDPVMVAESGATLLEADARDALVTQLLPRATVVTPNVPEARTLAGAVAADGPGVAARGPDVADAVEALAQRVHALGPRYVVVTGGHREVATDLFYDGREFTPIPGERFPDGAAHGSGCTHSSVLAARLAWGDEPLRAARHAKERASAAIADGLVEIGAGAGPVDVLGLRLTT